MTRNAKPFLATAFAALLAAAPLAQAQEEGAAQDAPDPAQVVATVNGTEITLAHVIAVRADLPRQYDQFPAELLYEGIVGQLVDRTLLMQSHDGELSLRSRTILDNEERALKAGEVIAGLMAEGVDEEELTAAYDAQYPETDGQKEYRASHILVETEEEAQALVTQLEEGGDFAALARENSTGPSASVGGDLGWFGEGDMVSEFYDAVTELEPGETSGPVQTDFGWHVILLAETRDKERPDFETVRAELADQLQQDLVAARVDKLAEGAEIDRAEPGFDLEAINNPVLLEN